MTLDQFLLRDITFTDEYAEAIELKQVALEGKEQPEHEAEQIRALAKGHADAIELEGEARANALTLIADALQRHPDLVTYHYTDKLSPNIRVMLVPSENPFILPLPSLAEALGTAPTAQQNDVNPSQQTDVISQP